MLPTVLSALASMGHEEEAEQIWKANQLKVGTRKEENGNSVIVLGRLERNLRRSPTQSLIIS
jgi:hypothetical protein